MSVERDLLGRWHNGDLLPEEYMALMKETKELLAQPDQDLREDLREGISLRDHFACAAMQGLLISMKFKSGDLCLTAYAFADVMMAEREKNDH